MRSHLIPLCFPRIVNLSRNCLTFRKLEAGKGLCISLISLQMQENTAGQCLYSELFLLSRNFLTTVGHVIPDPPAGPGWFSFGFEIDSATLFDRISLIECLRSQDRIPTNDLAQSAQEEMFAEINPFPQDILLEADSSREERRRTFPSSLCKHTLTPPL